MKKNKEQSTKMFKFSGIALVVMIGSFIGFATTSETEVAEEPKKTNVLKSDESKKVETNATAQEKAEVKDKNEDVELYKQEISGHLDAFQDEFDTHWDNNWVSTFNGISDGTIDVYTAYSNLNTLDKYYAGLSNKIRKIELPKLSKENQEYVDAYLKHMKNSSNYRGIAAADAAKMIDEGNVKPSVMEDIQSIVESSNNELMQAAINRTQLEMNLGLIEE